MASITKREFVSEIKGDLRAHNIDQRVSPRFILAKADDYVKDIIHQRKLTSLLWDSSFVTPLDCFEMERIEKIKCPIFEFRTCDKIMRSKKKLPEVMITSMGDTIISVTNAVNDAQHHIDYQRLYKPTDYASQKKREFGGVTAYYYVLDGYLWLLGTTNRLVNIVAVFNDENEVNEASECTECDECAPALDSKFVCPEKYRARVKRLVLEDLFSFYKRNIVDENPDLDENQKSAVADA